MKPRERYWSELTDPEPDSRLYKTQPGQFRSELHERLVNPLYPIAFAFLIVAFVGQARSTRSNRLQGLLAAFLIGAICRLVGLALTNAVARNPALVVPLYGLPLGVIGLSLMMIKGADHQKKGLALVDKAVDACAPVLNGVRRLLGRSRRRKAIP